MKNTKMHAQQQTVMRFINILCRIIIFVICTASFALGEDEGSQAPSLGPTIATPQPVTPQPVTPQPVVTTPEPTTPQPVTDAPISPAPVTPAPTDPPPTPAPITPQPTTPAPVTPQPVVATPAPVTPAPIATSSPTIFICEVCADDAPVTNPDNMVGDITCQQLQDLGRAGMIPQANCVGAQNAVPALCGCGTAAPVVTPSPTISPSAAMTDTPTNTAPTTTPATTSPSTSPTATTTDAPTAPSTQVTSSPSSTPSTQTPTMIEEPPSEAPSMGPTGVQTMPPSSNPSGVPTGFSDVPSMGPSMVPTEEPSMQPSEVPSVVPSAGPSEAPTEPTGTDAPTIVEQSGSVMEAQMTLEGISGMDFNTTEAWIDITEQFSEDYFQNSLESYETTITIKKFITSRRVLEQGILRGLQSEQSPSLTVVYDQEFLYRSTDSTVTPESLATAPFNSQADRLLYGGRLKDLGGPGFADLEGVSAVEVPSGPTEEPAPTPTAAPFAPIVPPTESPGKDDENTGGLSTGAIIGIAVAGGVALILCCLGIFFMSGGDDDKDQKSEDAPDEVKVAAAGGGGDEVSALEPPPAGASSNVGSPGYGDQSVATVDYDYSKAYGGGGDTSVSSAGGTFGSNTQGQSQAQAATAGALGSFEDGESLDKDPNSSMKEDLLNIFAPPGKLGVVIDTPDDGAPVVHAVKESSIIADKIKVGDKLVAVDDEDVRSMTAIKVSKLISRKSSNPTRKLTVIRTSVVEGESTA